MVDKLKRGIELEKLAAVELRRALRLVSTIPTFQMSIDAHDGRFKFELGHRAIGYDDSWTPVQYYAELDELAERLYTAYDEYQHVQKMVINGK